MTGSDSTYSAVVNQAVGMISVQAKCRIEEAFALMWRRADASQIPIEDIAAAVIDRASMERVPGINTARVLFDRGLWFDGVVRGLVAEVGLTTEEAILAAIAATRERFERAATAANSQVREAGTD